MVGKKTEYQELYNVHSLLTTKASNLNNNIKLQIGSILTLINKECYPTKAMIRYKKNTIGQCDMVVVNQLFQVDDRLTEPRYFAHVGYMIEWRRL